jgi:chromosome partitioning protein
VAVLSVVNSKGGSGKSTTALVLGLAFAEKDARVALIDADPNQPLVRWQGRGARSITVLGGITDSQLVPLIDREAAQRDAVIVDVEGVVGRMASRAIARSDLVLIPMGASMLDAIEAHKTISLVREEEQIHRRTIPFRVLLVRTGQIATKDERAIIRELDAKGISRLRTNLHQRVAFSSLFSRRTTLAELPEGEVAGVAQARANAAALADEVTVIIKSIVAERVAA